MRYLLDTGILVRGVYQSAPLHREIAQALYRLHQAGHALVTTRQNIIEYWAVGTRPVEARGGFGWTIDEANRRLRIIERWVAVLNEPDSIYPRWKKLVLRHAVSGRQVHDARIVAVMLAYRIKHIITLNAADFRRYTGLIAVTPTELIAQLERSK
jgi:predicted nucleic acid-binding protein